MLTRKAVRACREQGVGTWSSAAGWRPTPGCARWPRSAARRRASGCGYPGRACAPTTGPWSPRWARNWSPGRRAVPARHRRRLVAARYRGGGPLAPHPPAALPRAAGHHSSLQHQWPRCPRLLARDRGPTNDVVAATTSSRGHRCGNDVVTRAGRNRSASSPPAVVDDVRAGRRRSRRSRGAASALWPIAMAPIGS